MKEILNTWLRYGISTQECIDSLMAKGVTKEKIEENLYLFTAWEGVKIRQLVIVGM